MITRVFSAAVVGIDATEIEIEVNAGPGTPQIVVVGLPDTAVKESKDRVIAALSNSGYRWLANAPRSISLPPTSKSRAQL